MTSTEDLWEWIHTPLDELKRQVDDEPDTPWTTRRAEFLEGLGLREPDEHPLAKELFERLDQMTDDDRTTAIRSGTTESMAYELAQQHGVTDGSAYDEQAWQAYLAENGPAWDGTEQGWSQYTQWFLYYADERDVRTPAAALVEYLEPMPVDERITALAQYGVTITPAAPDLDRVMTEMLDQNPQFAAIPEERRKEILAEVFSEDQL